MTVLGPGSDGHHETHIHLDLAERRNDYKICQWLVHDPQGEVPVAAGRVRPARPSAVKAARENAYANRVYLSRHREPSLHRDALGATHETRPPRRSDPVEAVEACASPAVRCCSAAPGIAALSGGGLVTYAGAEAATALDVTRYRLTPRGWPAGQRLSITVIADLHAGGPNMGIERIRNIVDTANALRSDLMLLLGDYVATHRFVTEHGAGSGLGRGAGAAERAAWACYAILGNHDWWFHQAEIRASLKAARIPLMENQAMLLGEPGTPLLARRARRSACLSATGRRVSRRRRSAGDALAGFDRRSGDPDGARARHLSAGAGPGIADACRAHPWRPDSSAADLAGFRAVELWRALRLRAYSRRRPRPDRVRRSRHQHRAAAARRSAGNRADRSRWDLG